MAQTLLQITNSVLRKVGFITSEQGELTSLVDSARQVEIDIIKANTNTAIEELYSLAKKPYPQELAETTITLVTDQREYTLPSDLNEIRYPVVFEEDQHQVWEYPGGFEQMRIDQPDPSNYTGRPVYAVISPQNDKLRFDYIPTSEENGDGYKLIYDKDVSLDVAADEVPFNDTVSRFMVEVIAQDWRRDKRRNVDEAKREKNLAMAARYLNRKQPLETWGVRRAQNVHC